MASPGVATGAAGSMFAVQGGYLKRATDFRSVLGEVIRAHLGATDAQMQAIVPGYQTEPELGGRRVVAASSIDGTPIIGLKPVLGPLEGR